MAKPVDPFTPTTGTLEVYRFNSVGGSFIDSGLTVEVTNRDPNASAVDGAYGLVEWISGEWRTSGARLGGGDGTGEVVVVDSAAGFLVSDDEQMILADPWTFGADIIISTPVQSADNSGNHLTIYNASVAAGVFAVEYEYRVQRNPVDVSTTAVLQSGDFINLRSDGGNNTPADNLWWLI
jgi:hypothetical protein